MIRHTFDWRISPLRAVMIGIEAGIERAWRLTKEDAALVDMALDDSESLLGVALVAAQTYIEGTVGDVWRFGNRNARGASKPSRKLHAECLSCDVELASNGITRVGLLNAAANYYKHHESARGLDLQVWRALNKVGITCTTEYPCSRVTEILCGRELRLRTLCDILAEWRASTFAALCHMETSRGQPTPSSAQHSATTR